MKPTMEILARISQNSSKNKEEVFTRLYRYLLRPDIYYEAYRNLYANSGAATKGVNEDITSHIVERPRVGLSLLFWPISICMSWTNL